jgi:hypothetical protein
MPSVRVPGFDRAIHGFLFSNSFTFPLALPHLGNVTIPVQYGLCGGMAYAARDFYETGRVAPRDTVAPAWGTALTTFLLDRLLDTLPPEILLRYIGSQSPLWSDHDTLLARGRAWVMITEEWPRVQADLDAGHPSPLGLIRIKSLLPHDAVNNHQVLAYGYDLEGDDLTLYVYDPNDPYDPNAPQLSDVRLSLNIGNPQHTTPITYTSRGNDDPVFMFFRTNYVFQDPGPWGQVAWHAEFVSQSVPSRMEPGASVPVTVTMRNAGALEWPVGQTIALGSHSPPDNVIWGTSRVALPHGVRPQETVTFQFQVASPQAPGVYRCSWRMVNDGVTWFGRSSDTVEVVVRSAAAAANDAMFVSASVPTLVRAGDGFDAEITLLNSGANVWSAAGGYRLGSQNPPDNERWGTSRVELPVQSVAPGERVTFAFSADSNAAPGRHSFQWQMVQDGVEWFGQKTSNTQIRVLRWSDDG